MESEERLIEERKRKLASFFKKKYNWIAYGILTIIVIIAIWIRTRNLPGLKDVTTGTWTLGPDLDPFLFLRWAKYIVENGSLMAVDMMRYVPLGYETRFELPLLPYMIAWFHKFLAFGTESVTHSAVIFPVFMFALTVIAFFFLVRKVFEGTGEKRSNVIALISSLLLTVHPSLLPRTIAGIPEKESIAFFFMFATFYFFLCAWKSENKTRHVYALLAGISTGLMGLAWGGYIYVFVTIGLSLFIAFFFGQINKKRFISLLIWFFSALLIMTIYSDRYGLRDLATSTVVLIAFAPILVYFVDRLLFGTKFKKYLDKGFVRKIPRPLVSLIITIILGIILMTVLSGPDFITRTLQQISRPLITPINDRLGVTVAENRQPYFDEWASSFGPILFKLPVFFWLFFFASVYLFYKTLHNFSKSERRLIVSSYFVFLITIVFSRYSPSSLLNGTNAFSITFYLIGVLALVGSFAFVYYREYKKGDLNKFTSIDFGLILLFSLFFFSVVSARGAVRTIMVLVPSASMLVSFLLVSLYGRIKHSADKNKKIIAAIIFIVILLLAFYSTYKFYQESVGSARVYSPTVYNQQWQKAMGWTRDNTPQDAVFAHWWDYGYWVQSIGERATVLDGGNAQVYWNHFMGRYALTGTNSREAAEFLYAHKTSHFLIDSTDIGKYGAFSSIGSDPNYDRRSYINAFSKDNSRTVEGKNSTILYYFGGFVLDEDVRYSSQGEEIFLPGINGNAVTPNLAGLGAIRIEIDKNLKISQPVGIFVHQGRQYEIPLRYAFYNGSRIDFESGIEAGVFFMPLINQASNGQVQIEENGVMLYLSARTVNSQLARLYLYGEEDEIFRLAHSEDDFIVASLKAQGLKLGDIVYYGGVRGPIKIWEIDYPSDMTLNEKFLETKWPDELRRV